MLSPTVNNSLFISRFTQASFRAILFLFIAVEFMLGSAKAAYATNTTIDDSASGWTWSGMSSYPDSNCLDGVAHGSNTKGASGQYTFNGNSVSVYTWKGPDGGKLQVYVDGVSEGTFSEVNSTNIYNQVLYSVSGLSQSSHTLKVVTTNTNWGMIDYIVVGSNSASPSPSPSASMSPNPSPTASVAIDDSASGWTWSGLASYSDSNAFDASAHGNNVAGNYGQYTFNGTGVNVYTWKGPNGGVFQIYIDGVSKGAYSLVAASNVYNQQLYSISGLAYGSHTIELVAQNSNWAMVDYIVVNGVTGVNTGPVPYASLADFPIYTNYSTNVDLAYGTDPLEQLDLYVPQISGQSKYPLVIFIHGGGWSGGDKEGDPDADSFGLNLVNRGVAFATLNYRLVTETPTTIQMSDIVHDIKGALRYLMANAAKYGLDTSNFIVVGESAGGHLAAFMGTTENNSSFEGTIGGNLTTIPQLKGMVPIFGPTNLLALSTSWGSTGGDGYAPILNEYAFYSCSSVTACQTQYSPLTYVSGLTVPAFILHGDSDTLVPYQQSQTFNQALASVGVQSSFVLAPGWGHDYALTNAYFGYIYQFLKSSYQGKAAN
jgi:acetyl esterase/lipase